MQVGTTTVVHEPGVYRVPADIDKATAQKMLRFGRAELLSTKTAPENKLGKVPENKTRVAKKTRRRRSTRSKSDG